MDTLMNIYKIKEDFIMSTYVVLQLGYGMQGKASLPDLLNNLSISKIYVADATENVEDLPNKFNDSRIIPVKLDAQDKSAVLDLMKKSNVVLDLLPGEFAFPMAELAAEAGVNLVSAMYLYNAGEQDENKRQVRVEALDKLNKIAQAKEITILEEFGMDPGIDLILGCKALKELDEVKVFHSYGAGFPELSASNNPLRYKFTWSIVGVMRSYLRPARIICSGKIVNIPADGMFAKENIHFLKLPEFDSELECFANGDSVSFAKIFGLDETNISMGRYICRWPGTGAFWSVMAKCGFLSSDPIEVGNMEVIPEAFCAALLGGQKQFYYERNQRDVGLIRSDVRGYKDGKPLKVIYQVLDFKDVDSGLTSMQRTVGFPMSIGAQMIMDGRINKKGVVNPIHVPFDLFMEELAKRGIHYSITKEKWDGNERP